MSTIAWNAARLRKRRPARAFCELDGWSFDPRYTEGRCPICGWVAPGAPEAPLWLTLARRFEWELAGLVRRSCARRACDHRVAGANQRVAVAVKQSEGHDLAEAFEQPEPNALASPTHLVATFGAKQALAFSFRRGFGAKRVELVAAC